MVNCVKLGHEAEGLDFAHAKGIVHRDVKPANVLLEDGPGISIRLLDFGLARFAEADTLTAVGDVPGTLAYISPERLRGDAATPASDIPATIITVEVRGIFRSKPPIDSGMMPPPRSD